MSRDASQSASPLQELRFALAEGDAVSPPADLRRRVLAGALATRPAGLPSQPPPPISRADLFAGTVASVDAVLAGLSDRQWATPALRDLDVQGLVGHLIGVEADFQRQLDGGPARPDDRDHVASTDGVAHAQAGRPPQATRADWLAATSATDDRIRRAGEAVSDARVSLYGVTLPVRDWLLVRAFELWTHEEDIRRAVGLPLQAPGVARLAPMTRLAVALLPAGLALAGRAAPGCAAQLVLTGGGGGTWSVPLGPDPAGPAAVRVVMDAADFCRVVANRYSPADAHPVVTGRDDLADDLLAGAAALAFD